MNRQPTRKTVVFLSTLIFMVEILRQMKLIIVSSETWCPLPPATPMATQRNCSRG